MQESRIPITDITPEPLSRTVVEKSPGVKPHAESRVKIHPPQSAKKIYIRSIQGLYENIRRMIGLKLFALFLLLPWVPYNGGQAILLDFSAQRFHMFGLTLWPQDLTLLAWVFIIAAFALFMVTAIWGRVWCGFACPQTVFTFMFVWVEEKVEGARNKRIHLDKQPLSAGKIFRKTLKHASWGGIATITAVTFVGYFTPISNLTSDLFTFNVEFWPAFYVAFFALCTYLNAGWMREIMCTHMCPYSRFQSSMFDKDTITVTYDTARGEGRGPRSRRLTRQEINAKGLGDCIDCNLCVQVCPTGIDIRNGLQYECINCGACVDACNGVMVNMGYQKDLISFTSESTLADKAAKFLRLKVIGYLTVLMVMVGVFSLDLMNRSPMELDVIKDRTSLYRETVHGNIANTFTLVVMNKLQSSQHIQVSVEGLKDASVQGNTKMTVPASELLRRPLTVEIPHQSVTKSVMPFSFVLTNQRGERVVSETRFLSGRGQK